MSSSSMKELIELRHLYDEAVKSNSQLEQELNAVKVENSEALNKAAQDYEERVLLLLSKLSNKVSYFHYVCWGLAEATNVQLGLIVGWS